MLGIQHYNFLIGTKIPFSDWPEIVKGYMKDQSLEYKKVFYFFDTTYGEGGERAIKDCPQIGPIRIREERNGDTPYLTKYLTNLEGGAGCTEEDIMKLMPKIYRRYGFSQSHIIYQGVNFFSKDISPVFSLPRNNPYCVSGSQISLHRDSVFPRWSSIDFEIVIYDGDRTYDPMPYFEAAKKLLPGFKHMGYVECCLSEEELKKYEVWNAEAEPLVKRIKSYMEGILPKIGGKSHYPDTPKLSPTNALKKVCGKYGFTYIKSDYSVYFLKKTTPNGHSIVIEADMGPSFKEVGFSVQFIGAGFKHWLWHNSCYPKSQDEMTEFFIKCFDALELAEKEVIPEIDAYYPRTPDWFVAVS